MITAKFLNSKLVEHQSDCGLRIRKIGTNEIYDEAIDLIENNYEYEEISDEEYEKIRGKKK